MVFEEGNCKDKSGYDKELIKWRGYKEWQDFFSQGSRIQYRGLRDMKEGLTTDLRLQMFLHESRDNSPKTRPVCRQKIRRTFYKVAKLYNPAALEV